MQNFINADLNKKNIILYPNENLMRIMVINCHENNITKQTLLMLVDIGFTYFMQNIMCLFSFVHCQNHILKYLVNRSNKY